MSHTHSDSPTGPVLYSFKKNGWSEWMQPLVPGDFWVTASARAAQRGFANGAASVWKGSLGNKVSCRCC